MDFETILGLLAVIAMLIAQAVSKKKKQQKQQSKQKSLPASGPQRSRPSRVEEALREIQRALEPPEPAPSKEPELARPPQSKEFAGHAFAESKDDTFAFKAHDTEYHKEETFESYHGPEVKPKPHPKPRKIEKGEKQAAATHHRQETPQIASPSSRRSALITQLRHPQYKKSAIVLSELYGPPKSKQKREQ